ncbi:MAG: hypothetical protein WCQ86_07635, partial [Bacteroidaceae bacterium]
MSLEDAKKVVENKEAYKFRSGITTMTLEEIEENRKYYLKDFDEYTACWTEEDEENDISEYAGETRSDYETLDQYLTKLLTSGRITAFKNITYQKDDQVRVKKAKHNRNWKVDGTILEGPYDQKKTGGTVYLIETPDGREWVKDYDISTTAE